MPRVPMVDGPQVQATPMPGPYGSNIDVSSNLRNVAAGLEKGSDVVQQIQERDAQDEAFKLELAVRSDWNAHRSKLRGQYKGEQADQYGAAAQEWWAKAPGKYATGASRRAQELATRSIGQFAVQAQADTLGYVEGEKKRTREISYRTLQEGDIAEAANTATPENVSAVVGTSVARIRERAVAYATAEGLKPEVGERLATEQLGKFHAAMAISLASREGGTASAKAYLVEFGSDIPLDVRTRVGEIVKKEANSEEARTFAAGVAALPLAEQIAKAGAIKDADVREKALLHVRQNHAMVTEARREVEAEASDRAWQLVGQGKRVPEALLSAMDGKSRVQLQEHVVDRAKRLAEGGNVKTDWAVYIDARERLLSEDPAVRATVNLQALTGKIAPAQLEQLLDVKSQLARGTAAKDPKQDSLFSTRDRVNRAYTELGIDPKHDPKTAGMLADEVDKRLRTASRAKGDKLLTPEEEQAIIDGVAKDLVYTPRFMIPDKQRPLALVPQEELKDAFVIVNGKKVALSTVPMADRQEIIRERRRRGLPVTEQAIVETFMRAQTRSKAPEGSF